MGRHYRNPCGKGKAASNTFLTNLVTASAPFGLLEAPFPAKPL